MTSETKRRYVVEGAWLEGNDGSPVTTDWVVAANEDEAEAMVDKVRSQLESWQMDFVLTFEDYLRRQRSIMDDMEKLTPDEVTAGWEETKRNLGWDEDEPEACPHCGKRNFERLEDDEWECYDCGETFVE